MEKLEEKVRTLETGQEGIRLTIREIQEKLSVYAEYEETEGGNLPKEEGIGTEPVGSVPEEEGIRTEPVGSVPEKEKTEAEPGDTESESEAIITGLRCV